MKKDRKRGWLFRGPILMFLMPCPLADKVAIMDTSLSLTTNPGLSPQVSAKSRMFEAQPQLGAIARSAAATLRFD